MTEADRVLERLSMAHGPDEAVRLRLRPMVTRILECCPPSDERTDLLRLVGEIYEMQVRVKSVFDSLRQRLRNHRNALYGQMLGIEPPNLAA